MAVRTRKDVFTCTTRIDTTQIVAASKLVSGITGFPVQPNKAIVGANAFAHESGIHQDGVLKQRETYEIMRAEDVGWGANKLVLGKLSGRNAFKPRLDELGIDLPDDDAVNTAFARFKELADKKGEIFDEDLHALVSEEGIVPAHEHYKLAALQRHVGNRHAAARARRDERRRCGGRRRGERRRPGRCGVQGDRADGGIATRRCCSIRSTRSPAAPKRRARSPCACSATAHRQRTRRRHRHRRRFGQGVHQCAEPAARRRASG